jgi:hypothetical protein
LESKEAATEADCCNLLAAVIVGPFFEEFSDARVAVDTCGFGGAGTVACCGVLAAASTADGFDGATDMAAPVAVLEICLSRTTGAAAASSFSFPVDSKFSSFGTTTFAEAGVGFEILSSSSLLSHRSIASSNRPVAFDCLAFVTQEATGLADATVLESGKVVAVADALDGCCDLVAVATAAGLETELFSIFIASAVLAGSVAFPRTRGSGCSVARGSCRLDGTSASGCFGAAACAVEAAAVVLVESKGFDGSFGS